MAWYHKLLGIEEKLNPAQQYQGMAIESSREPTQNYEYYYENIEIVNRGVNMIVDDVAEIPATVVGTLKTSGIVKGVKRSRVELLLNVEPNPYQDVSSFKRALITDYLLDGNIFIYFDGAHLYHLPSSKMAIEASETNYVCLLYTSPSPRDQRGSRFPG